MCFVHCVSRLSLSCFFLFLLFIPSFFCHAASSAAHSSEKETQCFELSSSERSSWPPLLRFRQLHLLNVSVVSPCFFFVLSFFLTQTAFSCLRSIIFLERRRCSRKQENPPHDLTSLTVTVILLFFFLKGGTCFDLGPIGV